MSDFRSRVENLSPKRLALLALELQSRIEELERQRTEPIAIVGMGCRLPGAEGGPEAFWRLLHEGRNAIGEVPAERWDAQAFYDANIDAPGRMATKWGGFISDVDRFDAPFFGIAGREANGMDPQHRILLEVCWEAIEHSGYSPRKLGGTATGVFVGICSTDYQTMLLARGEEAIDAYLASGTSPSIAAGRISYTLGLQGPSMAIDTACSASLVAVHLACQHLRTRECNMALAGGVNCMLSPDATIALSKAHMMAPDGRCKTFDSRADGFVRAEGCGLVVLKRLSDAVADGDHILAVIRGSAVNQDGRSSGITAPNGTAQEAVIRSALAQAGVRPDEIGYVEAHGTGTALGDPIEAHALAAALGPGRDAGNPLVIGSVKTNVGHLESAAGVTGLIKVVLALQHEQIPPHLHFQQINPHIDWGNVPVEIPTAGRAWPRGEKRRLAGLSSFGFSGTNAHAIIEEAPAPAERKRTWERGTHILALSAKNEVALRQLGERYGEELAEGTVDLADLCYTANAGRTHFEQRLAVVASTHEEMRRRLLEALPEEHVAGEGIRTRAFISKSEVRYPEMGQELRETNPVFRAAIEETGDTQTALTRLWQSWGIEPGTVAAGVSLQPGRGEWEQILESLAQLYEKGADVNWAAFDQPYDRRRVPLPTYPFQRQRYWAEMPPRRAGNSLPAADAAPADWFSELSWQPRTATMPRKDSDAQFMLVASEDSKLAAEIALRSRGTVISSPDILSALKTAQDVASDERGARLWIVTAGAQAVLAGESAVDLTQAQFWGFGRTFALEHPDSWGGLVDLDPNASADQNAMALASIIESAGEDQIAIRGGRQYVARLAHRPMPSIQAVSFTTDKTYLITGGLGGLGLKTAEWMVGNGARNLVLVGRKAPSGEASASIEQLRRAGARVEIQAADVSSLPEIEAVFRKVRETMPGLGGIVHAAGVIDDGLIAQLTPQQIEKVLLPKTRGAWNLHRLTAGMPLDLFVLFSSAASVVGSRGQAGYAAANAYLDALAWQRRATGLPAVSINWGGWADVGMAARLVAQGRRATEFRLMPPDRALAGLGQALASGVTQIAIGIPEPSATVTHAKEPLSDYWSAPPGQRQAHLIAYLLDALAPILGVEAKTIDVSKPITDFGLDSLMALDFRNRLNADLKVRMTTVRLLRGFSLEEIAGQIEAESPETQKQEPVGATSSAPIEFPLSFGQQAFWFGHKMMPDSAANNVGLTASATPSLDWQAFERAVIALTKRHAALRTVFYENDSGLPMQRVLAAQPPDALLIDASSWSDEEIREAILHDFQRPLPLDQPVFRVRVYRRADDDVVSFQFDHIIIDHWSVRVCIEDLRKIYTAELTGSKPDLEPLEAEYSDFVEWERRKVERAGSDQSWEYWKRQLSGDLPILRLPSSGERPAVLISRGEALPLAFTREHWRGVQRVARECQATGYSVLLAVFQALLYRYTGQTDVVVGTSVSGRENPKWVNMLGLFINVMALRGDLSGNLTFAEFLVRTRDTVLQAMEHQEFPFSLLVARLRRPRNLERMPIYQSFFNFLTDRSGSLRSLFMGVQDSVVDFGQSKLRPYLVLVQQEGLPEVGVQMAEIDGQLVGYLNYNSGVLDRAIAEAMAADYCQALDAIIRNPSISIEALLPPSQNQESDREKIVF